MFKFLNLLVLAAMLSFCTDSQAKDKQAETVTLTKYNTVVMDMVYTDETVAKVALAVRDLDENLAPWKPIYLVVLSPGGSIESGLELIDNLNAMERKIETITLFGASMAFQNVQGVPGTRYVTSTGTLMSHKARGGFNGEFPGQLDSRYQYYLRRIGKLDETTVARSRGKFTLETYRQAYENEFWCEGQDCVDKGVADKVARVNCDSTLNGTKEVTLNFEFMGMPVEVKLTKAACPTITGVLKMKVRVEGQDVVPSNIDALSKTFGLSAKDANELRLLVERKIEELSPTKNSADKY